MARHRKTIRVNRIKELVNKYLVNSADHNRGLRLGNAIMLEQVLMETRNYKGFGYLNKRHMKNSECGGTTVGINNSVIPAEKQTHEELFNNTDDSRRFYY